MSTSIKLPKYKIGLWDILFKGYPEFAHNVFMMNPERAIPKKEIDEAWSSLIRAKWEVWCATEADKKEEDGRQFLLDSGLEMVSAPLSFLAGPRRHSRYLLLPTYDFTSPRLARQRQGEGKLGITTSTSFTTSTCTRANSLLTARMCLTACLCLRAVLSDSMS